MMFEYVFLQEYWWFLVSLLGALLVFLMFVQGGQSLIWCLGKDETQRQMLLASTGRKWELTFTTLVTFGGAFFASFPLFYSTSFGGAYWVWFLILLCFVVQAVSYEFQLRKGNLLGTRTYRIFLFTNGVLAPVLVGTAVGTFFHGAEFTVNKSAIANIAAPVISQWDNSLHGLEAVLNPWNLCLGLAVFFLSRVLARLYFINNIADDELVARARQYLPHEAGLFLLVFLSFLIHLLCTQGFAVNPSTGVVFMQELKYLHNLLEMPSVLSLLLLGVVLVLTGIGMGLRQGNRRGIWAAGTGTVLTVLALLLCAGWKNTAYYPSTTSLQSSLTLENSSSSHFTLNVMFYVSLFIPVVLFYITCVWRALNREPITRAEVEQDKSHY